MGKLSILTHGNEVVFLKFRNIIINMRIIVPPPLLHESENMLVPRLSLMSRLYMDTCTNKHRIRIIIWDDTFITHVNVLVIKTKLVACGRAATYFNTHFVYAVVL